MMNLGIHCCAGYPELTRDDIQAALEYARHSILHTEITALGVA